MVSAVLFGASGQGDWLPVYAERLIDNHRLSAHIYTCNTRLELDTPSSDGGEIHLFHAAPSAMCEMPLKPEKEESWGWKERKKLLLPAGLHTICKEKSNSNSNSVEKSIHSLTKIYSLSLPHLYRLTALNILPTWVDTACILVLKLPIKVKDKPNHWAEKRFQIISRLNHFSIQF